MESRERKHTARLGSYEADVDNALQQLANDDIVARIWQRDHTVWRPDPEGIVDRLGWLNGPQSMQNALSTIQVLVEDVQADGYTHARLLGMGGSSLSPEVFRETFGVADGYLDLAVVDSTDPDYVQSQIDGLDLSKTLFIVSSKSGSTVETLSFFKYYYNRVAEAVGEEKAGEHFVAITDPGSKLETLSSQLNFRATFLNDPHVGGRSSVYSYFGMVPAALVGVDLSRLLERAQQASQMCQLQEDNPGAWLGVIMGTLANAGRDKLTIVASPRVARFAEWAEQLIAESTGKEDKGIVPVVGEPLGTTDLYGNDRLFVYLSLADDSTHDSTISALEQVDQPVVRLQLTDIYDLGQQFFIWIFATAIAGHIIDVQPFDQPNVESAKIRARKMVQAYTDSGALPEQDVAFTDRGITVYGEVTGDTASGALQNFLEQAGQGDYICLQAYVQPTLETDRALLELRTKILDNYRRATTLGYGPRFLHSTGQLHKGDDGSGLFVQFTSDPDKDIGIPDEAGKPESSITFGVLKSAQALGDGEALRSENRRIIRLHLGQEVVEKLNRLSEDLA